MVFCIMGYDDVGGYFIGVYVVKMLKVKCIVVIDDCMLFGVGLVEQFIKGVQVNGGIIVDCQYVNDKMIDFSGVLIVIKGKCVDFVFFGGFDV